MHIEAVVVGKGIPLFAPENFDLHLDITGVRQVTDRIVPDPLRRAE